MIYKLVVVLLAFDLVHADAFSYDMAITLNVTEAIERLEVGCR